MTKRVAIAIVATGLILGCKPTETITLPEQVIEIENPNRVVERPIYNPSRTKLHDLVHTKLDVRFNWEKAYLYGKAELTLTPYFYPSSTLELNAKGFDINKVELITDAGNTELTYSYDDLWLTIDLGNEYTRKDTFRVFIDYTAKPDELEAGGSAAITSDKGLYFINKDGKENKPQQIWTQGETEASSCWFPTIDAPNERTTQEMAITVAEKYKTLSNGILMHSELNGDGTRTDYWEMNLPHAPYLFMMAVGDFAVVKDKWRELEVDYWVEYEYEEHAKEIFGLTPEMMEFYSTKLGVDYPWQKYSQVVVRDYVSGAMENTTCVIHGDFLHQTKREMIDGNNERIIAHELFHHWFGDLVTCESWSNLPLNESFATYGEYLWDEYKHGKDKADHHGQQDLGTYLQESKNKQVDMVRFDFFDKEEMFDAHSYQKGGRILHMLRMYVGDEAFFESLKKYLNDNKYTDVEMDELRIAFEEVTGEDLNWFFDQWFYSSGHPELNITYDYVDSSKTQVVNVEQMQNLSETPLYYLPLKIDIYQGGKVYTKDVVVDKSKNTFEFKVDGKPDLVNFDADKALLCEKVDKKTNIEEWIFMYYNAPKYLDRYEALKKLSKSNDSLAKNAVVDALNDNYWNIRKTAIRGIKRAAKSDGERVKAKLIDLAKNDRESKVRGDAIRALAKYFDSEEGVKNVYITAMSDESYFVLGRTLDALTKSNEDEAMRYAKTFEDEKSAKMLNAVASVYAEFGEAEHHKFFVSAAPKITSFDKYPFVQSYSKYLKGQDDEVVKKGLPTLLTIATKESAWWMRMSGIHALNDLETLYSNRIHSLEDELKEKTPGSDDELSIRNKLDSAKNMQSEIEALLNGIKENETNPMLRKYLGLDKEK